MPGRRDQDQVVGVDHHGLEAVEHGFVLHEADIDFPIHDLSRNFLQASAIDADLDLRKLTEIAAQRSGQEIDGRGLIGGDGEVPRVQIVQPADVANRVVAELQHLACVVDKRMASFGQRQVGHVAGEQRHADRFLELLHALTDRRLCAMNPFGRAREASLFGNGEKVLQLQQVHTSPSGSPRIELCRMELALYRQGPAVLNGKTSFRAFKCPLWLEKN